jgi:ABC-2 type transport system ATP-binding protein
MTALAQARGLTKSYGRHRGIVAVSFDLAEGEVFGFLGPNGAGKTTTLRTLMGLLRPTSGSATIAGLDCWSQATQVKRLVGYLPGEFSFAPSLTGAQILAYLGHLRGGVDQTVVAGLAERLELDLGRRFRHYSHGNKQKVGLVQAFMHDPELLVLDEPTSGLDPLMRQEFLGMVRESRAAGQTVFMSSHVLAEVQQAADLVGIVRDGRLVAVERVESLGKRAVRRVEVHFEDPVPVVEFAQLPGVRDAEAVGPILRCTVDGRLDPLIKAIARYSVVDVISTEPDLEETFLSYYYDAPEVPRGA